MGDGVWLLAEVSGCVDKGRVVVKGGIRMKIRSTTIG